MAQTSRPASSSDATSSRVVPLGTHAGFLVRETWYAPGAVLATHDHEGATLSMVFQGAYEEQLGCRAHECGALAIVYKPPQISHSNRIGRRGLYGLFVEIAPQRAMEAADLGLLIADAVCVGSPDVRGLVARLGHEVRARGAGFELAVEGLLLELWAAAARHRAPSLRRPAPPWLTRAHDYVCAHFRESIGLTDVARAAGVHPVHLAQTFRRRYGRSVGGFVRELRLEFARRALADSALPISRVALDAGFADHSHFTRAFRTHMGLTPSEYRRLLGPGAT